VYIVPTRFGLLWLAGVALLQLVAIQTRSNGTFQVVIDSADHLAD
tara:strand:+ start:590 stop:724 length:135 start_codon:yes stop_codon:yes gene_type:complete